MENPSNFQKLYFVIACFNPRSLLRNGDSLFNIDDKKIIQNALPYFPIRLYYFCSSSSVLYHRLYHKYQVQIRGAPQLEGVN